MTPRISIGEFLFTSGLSPERKAGFKAFVGTMRLAYRHEWEERLDVYLKR